MRGSRAVPSGQDPYIVSLGFVTSGSQLLGVVYGAGSDPALDENRIFARWLQKKLVFTDSFGTEYAVQGALGPDRQWLQIHSGTFQGTIAVYAEDGITPLAAGPLRLSAGKTYVLSVAPSQVTAAAKSSPQVSPEKSAPAFQLRFRPDRH